MGSSADESLGAISISEEVIAACVQNAVLNTKGVHSMTGGLTRNLLNKDPLHKGLKVNIAQEGVYVDVYVVVEYGVKIPEVAWDIQENVKAEIETLARLDVLAVNIHVQGVHFNEETEG